MNYVDTQNLSSYTIQAIDGDIGSVSNFYFDEDLFYLRYFIVDTSSFLLRNLVLVSPSNVKKIDTERKVLELTVTKDELENSPSLDNVEVISNQYEKAYSNHFNSSQYWSYGASAWALGPHDIPAAYYDQIKENIKDTAKKENLIQKAKDNGLRSSDEVRTYSVSGVDKEFGHIQGFLFDANSLSIDFVIVDTINFLPSKNVLLRPEWIKDISWKSSTVHVSFSKETIKSAPSYSRGEINDEIIKKSDDHFGRYLEKKIDGALSSQGADLKSNVWFHRSELKKFLDDQAAPRSN